MPLFAPVSGSAAKKASPRLNIFVMTDGGSIYTSTDGITWTSRTVPVTGTAGNITYDGGVITCGYLTSTDTISWTFSGKNTSGQFFGVKSINPIYGQGAIARYQSPGQYTFSSATGASGTGPVTQDYSFVQGTMGNVSSFGKTVVAGAYYNGSSWNTSNGWILTSQDGGATWTNSGVTPANNSGPTGVYTDGTVAVAVLAGSPTYIYSTANFSTWNAYNTGANIGLNYGMQWPMQKVGSLYVFSFGQSAASSTVWYSSDGVSWSAGTLPTTSMTRLTYANGVYLCMAGSGGTTYYTSTNFSTWTTRTAPVGMYDVAGV